MQRPTPDKKEPLLQVQFQVSLADFYAFNQHVTAGLIKKSKKKVTTFGILEVVMAIVFMVTNLFTKDQNAFFMILSVSMLAMGLFSIFFYPLFFERQMAKAVKKNYQQNDYFKEPVQLTFYRDAVSERSCVGEGSLQYSEIKDAYWLGENLILSLSETGGYILPGDQIERATLEQVKSLIDGHIKK